MSTPYEPQGRWGHTSVTIGDRVFMWGGRIDSFTDGAKKELSNVVDIFHISTERWEKKKTKGKTPLGLYNNAFTAIGEDLYVYGGWDGQAAHNTLHKFNTHNYTWQEMKSADSNETPMKMSGCGLVAKGDEELVLFGGYGLPVVPTSPAKSKNVSLLTTTATTSSGRSSRESGRSSKRRGSGKVSFTSSSPSQGESSSGAGSSKIRLASPGNAKKRRRKSSDRVLGEVGRKDSERRRPHSGKGPHRNKKGGEETTKDGRGSREAKETQLNGEAKVTQLNGEAMVTQLNGEAKETLVNGEAKETQLNGEARETQLDGEAKATHLNGEAEATQLSGEAEGTQLNGEAKVAQLNGEAEETQLNGEAKEAQLNGEAEETQLNGEAEETQLNGEAKETQLNGEAKVTQLNGGVENGLVTDDNGDGPADNLRNGDATKTSSEVTEELGGEEKEKWNGEESSSFGLTNGTSQEERNGKEEDTPWSHSEVSGVSENGGRVEESQLKTVDVEIHDQQQLGGQSDPSDESKKADLIMPPDENKRESKDEEKSKQTEHTETSRDEAKDAENLEKMSHKSADSYTRNDEDTARSNEETSTGRKTASSVEEKTAQPQEEGGAKISPLRMDASGLSAEERAGQGEITSAADVGGASQAERLGNDDEGLTVVGDMLTMMDGAEGGVAEGKEEEGVVVNKKWTNELKVYNIKTGKWMSPEVGGACPPPCVDFSFDNVEDGRRAILFGGYRPESGASSGAFVLDMETWTWTDLGNHESSARDKAPWPVARDGHTSCTIAGLSHPHILVSGGWDQDNKLLNDAWILDLHSTSWKKLSMPEKVGPRLWHRVVSHRASPNLWDLLFFGGCPLIPNDFSAVAELSWPKLNATVLLELGRVKSPGSSGEAGTVRRSVRTPSKHDWVIVDSLSMEQMGKEKTRTKEALLFTKYKAAQAEARAKKAEKLAQETLKKLNELLSLVQSGNCSIPSTSPLSQLESGLSTPTHYVNEVRPFWVVPRSDVQITMEEVGRGRWTNIRVAYYKGQKVAARCLYNQIVSDSNQKIFQESIDLAAKMRHPNILPFIGAVMEGEPMILTELMPTNLKRVLDLGRLQNYQVAGISLDIASALYFLHTMKPEPIVHGDLTSTSILLQKESGNMWKAKLADFVTTNFFQKMLVSTGGDGSSDQDCFSPVFDAHPGGFGRPRSVSPPFMSSPSHGGAAATGVNDMPSGRRHPARKISHAAPEIQEDPTLLKPQRDIYSLGLLLVEMCTGTPPLEVSLNFLIESVTWTEMGVVIKACLDYNPDLRPSIDAVLLHLRRANDLIKTRPPKHILVKGVP